MQPIRLLCPRGSPGKNTGVDCHFFLQQIFPTQESNLHLLRLLHCRRIHYLLSYQGIVFPAAAAAAAKSLQLCPTLCDPIDGSPPGTPVPGILQARTLEWVAISFSRGSSPPRNQTCMSFVPCIVDGLLHLQADGFYHLSPREGDRKSVV